MSRIGRHLGYRVLAVDPVPERRLMAELHGIEVYDLVDDLVDCLRDATGGRGPDGVVDAVGMEAHGNPGIEFVQKAVGVLPDGVAKPLMTNAGVDRLALHLALELVQRGGTVSLSGVYAGAADPMPFMSMFDKQVSLRMGQCNVHRWRDDLLPIVEDSDDPLGVEDLVTHRVPLDRAPEMYETFMKKEDGCVKVVLEP